MQFPKDMSDVNVNWWKTFKVHGDESYFSLSQSLYDPSTTGSNFATFKSKPVTLTTEWTEVSLPKDKPAWARKQIQD